MTPTRFLILEDDPADVELLSTTLNNSGLNCEFSIVETREDVFRILRTQPIDIVLSDYSLPTCNGLEVIKLIKEEFDDTIPCILVSGVLGEERAVDALKSGASNYVLKRSLERLMPAVKQALQESQDKKLLDRALTELQKNEARFRTSVETMTDCLIILKSVRRELGIVQDFSIEYINEMASQYLLMSPSKCVGQSIFEVIPGFKYPGSVDLFVEFDLVLDSGYPFQSEVCLWGCRKQHKTIVDQFVAIEMKAIQLDDGLVITWHDVTQRARLKQQNLRLLQASEEARASAVQANQQKDAFLASFSHELRSPISSMGEWLRLLEANAGNPEAGTKALEVIQRHARQLEQLASDFLDGSHILRGRFACDLRPMALIQLNQIVIEAINNLNTTSHSQDIQILFNADKLSGELLADKARLQRVCQNLLSNAVKSTPSRGQITVHLQQQPEKVVLSVTNTGKGISLDTLPSIFERLPQENTDKSSEQSDISLGLPVAKHIVEAHGGQIKAESEGKDKGSTFTVELPLRPVTDQKTDGKKHQTTATPPGIAECSSIEDSTTQTVYLPALNNIRVLVVDDQADSLEVCKIMLEIHEAEVLGAASADEALKVLSEFSPHVIVSDISMLNGDGYEFIRQVRSRPKTNGGSTPALTLTAYTEELDRTRALLAGFQLHLPKPVDFQQIVDAVALLSAQPSFDD